MELYAEILNRIIRIIFMIPVFAIFTFLSVAFNDADVYLKPVTWVYEGFALACFFLLLCAFVHENEEERHTVLTAIGAMKSHGVGLVSSPKSK